MEPSCSSEVVSTCSESEGEPKSKRSRKWSGAATYQTKFSPAWTKEVSFITSVSKDPYR